MDRMGGSVAERALEVLEMLSSAEYGTLPEDPVELVEMGFCDPIRVFVKNEPHGLDKIKSGKVRLICSVPLHMLVVEMLIFGPQNNAEIAQWDRIPSKPGLGLTEDGDVVKIWNEQIDLLRSGTLAEADVSGWDMSVSDLSLKLDGRRRIFLSGGTHAAFNNAVMNYIHCLSRTVFALSDGRLFKQTVPGIQKSGKYCTSSTNSAIRVMASYAIGSKHCIAMGDDSLEEYVENAIEKYLKLGIRIKFYKKCEGKFEFCSHEFVGGIAYPSNPAKMLFNLFHQSGSSDQMVTFFQQWAFEMRHHPEFEEIVTSVILRSGWAAQNTHKDGQQTTKTGSSETKQT